MKPRRHSIWISAAFGTYFTALACSAATPEQQTLEISKRLHPIPDEQWQQIAGSQLSQTYEVIKGDTLWNLSQRLFGDPKVWPKVWALNNGRITNPHRIRPGDRIAFTPGTGSTLPQLGTTSGVQNTDGPTPASQRSEEWKKLPRQSWEKVPLVLPPEIDPDGFDKRSRLNVFPVTGMELARISATEKLDDLGKIVGAQTRASFLGMGDHVYIEARKEKDLQVGELYSITEDPFLLKAKTSDRIGYAYPVHGKIRIIGVKDGLFVADVVRSTSPFRRGSLVIPLQPRVKLLTPIPGPANLEGTLVFDKSVSSFATAQYKHVFIDRGSEDGVQPGMVFRAYQHSDPATGEKLTESHFIVEGDVFITQVSERFSAAIVMNSRATLEEGEKVVMLTDVSDLFKKRSVISISADPSGEESVDDLKELERIDKSGDIGKGEAKDLQQLERWTGTGTQESLDDTAAAIPTPANITAPTAPLDPEYNFEELPPPPPTPGSPSELDEFMEQDDAVLEQPTTDVIPDLTPPPPSTAETDEEILLDDLPPPLEE